MTVGAIFGFTQQATKGFRGKNDAFNSAVAGGLIGVLRLTTLANPWPVVYLPFTYAFPAYWIHYGYKKWAESEYEEDIQFYQLTKKCKL